VDSIHHAGHKLKATPFRASTLRASDCVVIATAHKGFDFGLVTKHAKTIVDSRNALKGRRTRGVFRL
jgi:UDP-N-acetyl-D-glucosamine dehydrogenase